MHFALAVVSALRTVSIVNDYDDRDDDEDDGDVGINYFVYMLM